MENYQRGILAPPPALARYLSFSLKRNVKPRKVLLNGVELVDGEQVVFGIGQPAVVALGRHIEGLRVFPTGFGSGLVLPSTSSALWFWLRGMDRGVLLHLSRKVVDALSPAFLVESVIEGFKFDTGRDLTGYVDGTENPKGAKATAAAFVHGAGEGLDGSSFVAVQRWVHDFKAFEALSTKDQDNAIGRRRSDNKELTHAPASAHVKRTAQETFSPHAFVLRRSMPWTDDARGGLNFVAFGRSFEAYEAQLKRMVGAEDGIIDATFKFSQPISGSYFWCPPMRHGKLDLRALAL
ncbi:MAG TPA: Dyp-type peroxidase [Terriglobales bacterium]|nr:Dyp-type peroxidase [Terriglobales bacterium]